MIYLFINIYFYININDIENVVLNTDIEIIKKVITISILNRTINVV